MEVTQSKESTQGAKADQTPKIDPIFMKVLRTIIDWILSLAEQPPRA